jgi:nanoRNase/pAp phosphatase (c-di-AMP/oligoRNAs hydrolase)
MFGNVNVVDASKSSVAELVYDFFKHNNWKITKEVATCLLTGIITDTGSFRHSNTQASTFKAAGELLKNLKEKISLKHEADLLSIDLKEAVKFLKQVTGQEINETVLTEIFNKFCIGK